MTKKIHYQPEIKIILIEGNSKSCHYFPDSSMETIYGGIFMAFKAINPSTIIEVEDYESGEHTNLTKKIKKEFLNYQKNSMKSTKKIIKFCESLK